MEYTIKQVANIAEISVRTLHYYDEIDLLKPAKINESGYRIYQTKELDRLQQIMFYKKLSFSLEEIKSVLSDNGFSNEVALKQHYQQLQQERDNINLLLNTIEKTLKHYKGEMKMSDAEKFEAFKKQKIEENDTNYGKEIREKYGNELIGKSNKKFQELTQDDMERMKIIEQELFDKLNILTQMSNVKNETGKSVFELHKKWLSFTWTTYSAQAHKGLMNMYLADERFAKYYNQRVNDKATSALVEAVNYYA